MRLRAQTSSPGRESWHFNNSWYLFWICKVTKHKCTSTRRNSTTVTAVSRVSQNKRTKNEMRKIHSPDSVLQRDNGGLTFSNSNTRTVIHSNTHTHSDTHTVTHSDKHSDTHITQLIKVNRYFYWLINILLFRWGFKSNDDSSLQPQHKKQKPNPQFITNCICLCAVGRVY